MPQIAVAPAEHYGAALSRPVALAGATMGTTWSARLSATLSLSDTRIQAAVQAALDGVVAQMSHWDPDSDLARFNRAPAGWHVLPKDLLHVLDYALKLARETGGACDPTLGEWVDMWGFGPRRGVSEPPSQAMIAEAARRCGWQRLALDPRRGRAWQPGGLKLDLSAIAKGYGVDAAAWALDGLGLRHYLIEAGGELRARGRRPDGLPWRVAVEVPDGSGAHALGVALAGQAIATSGDYRRYAEHGGRRYAHTLDPRSGQPLDNDLASVTVLHAGCMQADALATALNVMGEAEGMAYARRHELAALFIVRGSQGLRLAPSPAFLALDVIGL
ncbi:FAD:protein FMN transferase [Bordetella hinzii]|uniref:FAD:protein FMN transferase n=1 Tax=Bordetella hinzii TaxID=103855 RepID=A0AAN1VE97_9BORD|nr:FAD:protein FMN transferase [Bordetella hinzii]AKQ54675.1 Thiamine biosynthesis lipoprotein ApbE precursor [Bordetella hinzii]AKQ59188.1 Thiamine biosynthesis lipoprotein ApbE precursor [Bordetella hinzii]AZW15554.1 FAD:protein FMN transferase [Bordetella hinzii]KCB24381.1 ApbE family protein [Bordetella hinzii L60]KCB34154.1 ApbE family protein [Bordetella hinzii CA90 BAL1384]